MSQTYAAPIGGAKSEAKEALPDKKVQSTLWPSVALLATFVMVWTLYGVISASPAAIHNDMAEAYVWGNEFQLGYEKHPPFWAWIAGFWFEAFPRADWALPFSRCSMLVSAFTAPGCSSATLLKAIGDSRPPRFYC